MTVKIRVVCAGNAVMRRCVAMCLWKAAHYPVVTSCRIAWSQPTFRQICRGEFDDYLNTCLFAMHDLTERTHLREIVMNLKLDHKEILFFLGIRLYTTQNLAELRGQPERNIRKVRDTVQRRIHRKLYAALTVLQQDNDELIHLEQDFPRDYIPPKRRHASDEKPV